MTSIVLASSSPFRQDLLKRLHLSFESLSPDIDEQQQDNEQPEQYVKRLSREKTLKIAEQRPLSTIIGSDQCAYLNGEILGKPGSREAAIKQLKTASGNEVKFYTGVCVLNPQQGFERVECVEFAVGFRKLNEHQIIHYLETEQPYNCAGSFKSEAYGITLFEYMRGDDPTALVGLPLIRLTRMLEEAGITVV